MQSLNEWFGVLWELLLDCEEELCFQLICVTRRRAFASSVDLIEGSLTIEEAINYARMLVEMGREFCAEEVLRAAAFGGVSVEAVSLPLSEHDLMVPANAAFA